MKKSTIILLVALVIVAIVVWVIAIGALTEKEDTNGTIITETQKQELENKIEDVGETGKFDGPIGDIIDEVKQDDRFDIFLNGTKGGN